MTEASASVDLLSSNGPNQGKIITDNANCNIKAILARRINKKKGCEDYENTFARME